MGKKAVVVTGAAGALGRAIAARLADDFDVIAVDMSDTIDLAEAPALALSGVDLADEQSVARAYERIAERFGSIHGLVNVAGGFAWETVVDGSAATWDRLYRINVATALNSCRAALPLLAAGGSIVNVGAAAAARAEAGMGAYAASKSGVARLTEALSAELKPRSIRANAVLPSILDTPANRADMPDADFAKWVSPAELANVVAFLLSDEARAITGALIPVTGRV